MFKNNEPDFDIEAIAELLNTRLGGLIRKA
jgi:hypothetical protein